MLTRLMCVAVMAAWFAVGAASAWAQGSSPTLHGTVTSDREGPMEGVLVSARRQGSPITVTVVSNAKGEYAFPAGRLEAGSHHLAIRAAGYALDGSDAIEIGAAGNAAADLKLKPAPITSDQWTNSEWLSNAPGPEELKRVLLNCTDCHSAQRIFESKHTGDEFLQVFDRMGGYYPGASDFHPQRLVGNAKRPPVNAAMARPFADYLAALNLSSKEIHGFDLKPNPRATGRATRVVITEYDLARKEIQPHDVVVDPDGGVWFSHFSEQFLSKLDPKTGKVTDYPIPVLKPNHPKGTLDLEVDPDGNIWVGMMYQGGMARFDRKTEQFRIYPLPQELQTDATQQSHFSVAGMKADGKLWVKNTDRSQVLKLDPVSGVYENLGSFKVPETGRPIGIYGIYADSQNNVYILEYGNGGIGRIDAKTNAFAFYPTPTPFARARRGRVDAQDRLWFAEYGANGVAMFDPVAKKITEWRKPLAWESPYDAVADRHGEVWEVNESSDRLGRLDPKTGEWVNYPLPRYSNLRRVFVDDRGPQLAVWTGNDHASSVIKLEPLD